MKKYKIKPEEKHYIGGEEMKKVKLLVAVPCYGGNITTETNQGLIMIGQRSTALDIPTDFYFITNESLVCRARNMIVSHFLSSSVGYTHLMSIDADTKFNGDDVFKMLHYNKDWVAGAVPVKTLPLRYVLEVQLDNGKASITQDKTLVELRNMGGAFNLMKRKVFEEMIEAYPETHCSRNDVDSEFFTQMVPSTEQNSMEDYKKQVVKNFHALYDTGLSSELGLSSKEQERAQFELGLAKNIYLSEDYTFAKRWKKINGKIWLDPRIPLGHVGSYTYEGNAMKTFPKSFWRPEDFLD